jgi:hypothetical protein
MEGKLKDLCYALDENGKYVQVYSTGWTPKNAAMKQAWDEVQEKVQQVKEEVRNGKKSPVAYYMVKNIMDIAILSQYLEIPKRRVKKHLKPEGFDKLDEETLKKYAQTFDISVEELCNPPEIMQG